MIGLTEKLLKGYQWEVFYQKNKKLKAESQNLSIDTYILSDDEGFSVRVIKDGKQGFAYGTVFNDEDIIRVINTAKELVDISSEDKGNIINRTLQETEKIEYFDTFGSSLPISEKVDIALQIEKLTKSYSPKIKKVRSAMFIEHIYIKELYNSYGIHIKEKGTIYTAMVAAVAEENGDSQISWGHTASRFLDSLNISSLVEETVSSAISLLGAKPIKTKRMKLLFSPYVASEFLGTFSSIFSGESLIKGKTLLKGMEGQKVMSSNISITDNGRLKLGVGTRTYDDEGVPTQRTVLVENGVFKGFLHNLYTSEIIGVNSTGNAVRRGIRTLPSVGITNLYIENGTDNIKEILNGCDEVFVVTDVMGLHTADPISGNFSIGASGILYSKGEQVMGVRGVTIADNFLELFKKVVAVGNDLKFYGKVGSPSLLFENVMVAGE